MASRKPEANEQPGATNNQVLWEVANKRSLSWVRAGCQLRSARDGRMLRVNLPCLCLCNNQGNAFRMTLQMETGTERMDQQDGGRCQLHVPNGVCQVVEMPELS